MNTIAGADERQVYEIRVEGHLNDTLSCEYGELYLTLMPNGETLITGPIVDQAQLFGILIRIRDMGIPLLSVNTIKNKVTQCEGGSK